MYKLVHAEREEEQAHEKKFGRFNDFPPNWKKITQEEFSRVFFTRPYELEEYRQLILMHGKPAKEARMFFYEDGTGVAIVRHPYTGGMTFFAFAACEHEYEALSQEQCRKEGIYHGGNCYHVSRCKKCGYTYAVDSGD